jgi:hypothetical protein
MTVEEAQRKVLIEYLIPILERHRVGGKPWAEVVRGCIDEIDARAEPSEADILVRKHLLREYRKMVPAGDA